VHSPFTIISHTPTGIDYYHFASHLTDKRINQIYLANIDLLYRFIDYFKEKVSQSRFLRQAYQFIIDLALFRPVKMTPFDDESIVYDRGDFFKSIQLHKNNTIHDIKLSKRQDELLQFIVHGKTIKEISEILQLSPRTIGHYFETVKMKFNVLTKSELINKTIETGYIKLGKR
jgi:DNA-binding CsgD family transcriptional regulator